jgi:hypothetical protein
LRPREAPFGIYDLQDYSPRLSPATPPGQNRQLLTASPIPEAGWPP